jgi:hypothetical protein
MMQPDAAGVFAQHTQHTAQTIEDIGDVDF